MPYTAKIKPSFNSAALKLALVSCFVLFSNGWSSYRPISSFKGRELRIYFSLGNHCPPSKAQIGYIQTASKLQFAKNRIQVLLSGQALLKQIFLLYD